MVNAAGLAGLAGAQVSVGFELAGQRVTLRMEGTQMAILGQKGRTQPTRAQAYRTEPAASAGQTEPVTQPPARIRCAVADDLDGVLRADHVAAQGDPERAEFLRSSLMLGQCQVRVADEAVTGFVIVRPAHFFGRDFIELLIVDPALRRSGSGRALLRHALATAGTSQVFTSTNASNHPMRSLLEAEDWSFSGELDGLDDDDPELVFYKTRPAKPAHISH